MDFELSEELSLLQKTVRDFARVEVAPFAAENDRKGTFPAEILKKASELGFLGILIPEEYGGVGLGSLAVSILIEEMSRGDASIGVILSVHNSLIGAILSNHATKEQKEKYLPRVATGELIGAYALTESNAGTDAANLSLKAEKKGDHYVLNGSKLFITSGLEAGIFIVFARTSREEKQSAGISAFIVEPSFEGFSIGTEEEKMGVRASSTVELNFEDCRVPAENLLGEEGKGFRIAMWALDGGRIGIGSQALGIAGAAYDASVKYAKERVQFGSPIASFQAIQWKLADMALELDAARLLIRRAAWLRDRGKRCTAESCMAKIKASEACVKIAEEAVQIHGGAGYTKEFPVERHFRDSRITMIYEGTSEALRMVLSREIVG
jgi:alkylation response protein AidB-like acyl-CoA dehydrogenase